MNIPDNMVCTISMIRKEQQKAVDLGKELVAAGYKFEGKGIYSNVKDRIIFKTGYKTDLEKEFFREVKFEEIVEVKPKKKRKKKLKQGGKKKK